MLIEKIETEDSFKDKIIGGIRGKNSDQIIKFIDQRMNKFYDEELDKHYSHDPKPQWIPLCF